MSKTPNDKREIVNRRARRDYHIGDRYDAGMVLLGWEVKALRAGRGNLSDAYVLIKKREAWLLGLRIEPLPHASDAINLKRDRTRKLLLNQREIARLFAHITVKGKTCVPLRLHWKGHQVKCEIAMGHGKVERDKRETVKQREWQRNKARILRSKR